jgi:hypothetical protein
MTLVLPTRKLSLEAMGATSPPHPLREQGTRVGSPTTSKTFIKNVELQPKHRAFLNARNPSRKRTPFVPLRSSTTETIALHEHNQPPESEPKEEHETQLVPQLSPPDLFAMLAEDSEEDTSPSLSTLESSVANANESALSTLSKGHTRPRLHRPVVGSRRRTADT